MAGAKPEFPPLLRPGLHTRSEADLHQLLVADFPSSKRRPTLWSNLLWLREELSNRSLVPCSLWLDGSYLTKKVEPDDIDLIVEMDASLMNQAAPDAKAFLSSLAKLAYHAEPMKLHTFLLPRVSVADLGYPRFEAARQQWLKDWGFSLLKREPKGIALLQVTP
jgi:hypothetical protein